MRPWLARQLKLPSGIVGPFILRHMNRNNSPFYEFALAELALTSSDRVLEVGFGGAQAVSEILASRAAICGVDPSTIALINAKFRFRREVKRHRALFLRGSAEALPVAAGEFTKVLSLNTIYFWSSVEMAALEFARVLRPGGVAAVGFARPERLNEGKRPEAQFQRRDPDLVADRFFAAGFRRPKIISPPGKPWLVLVIAERAGE